jgi:hypothetical protein
MSEINIFPKFVDQALTPVANSVGNTLTSVWNIVFGNIDFYAEKKHFQRKKALDSFKRELEDKISSIPIENLVEPPLHIIGPTLESSKFYFENNDLRSMFANLIAASINSDTNKNVHPSFVETIKQLSPLDAKNLTLFRFRNVHPLANYIYIVKNNQGFRTFQHNVFFGNNEIDDLELNSTSITNLDRLGLVNIEYGHQIKDNSVYEKFYNTDLFKKHSDLVLEANQLLMTSDYLFANFPLPDVEGTDIRKSLVSLSPYGSSFINSCLNF